METLTPVLAARHASLRLSTTTPTTFIDLTDRLQAIVAEAGVRTGLINVQSLHTTTAVVVNELEPMLLTDITALLERLAPADAGYRHDDALERLDQVVAGERLNGHAHCRAVLLGSAVTLNVVDGRLRLGRWQRVLFVELDGPREREVSVLIMGENGQ